MATAKPPQKNKLTDAPTNLKEAIDWVLRVTGKDGKPLNKETECICGLAAAVTDLLQSVELEYHGYQGDGTKYIQGLFSKVQSIEGTHVVRQLIDGMTTKSQLARLIGWSKGGDDNVLACTNCGCMIKPENGIYLGKGCTKCKDSGDRSQKCVCGSACKGTAEKCPCAAKGKCCKCYCKEECKGNCKDTKCTCIEKEDANGFYCRMYKDTYQSSYISYSSNTHFEKYGMTATWNVMHRYTGVNTNGTTPSQRRHQCAQILLGSVCLIWSGITYMYWTGKQYNDANKNSPYWNNHILDGTGLDDGTLSQWLQALGFPRDMLNNSGPGNKLEAVISKNFGDELFDGFKDDAYKSVLDSYNNTAKCPAGLNYGGFIHAINRDGFNAHATVFKEGTQHDKKGALYKLYILSCAYFTGLQKKTGESTTPTTTNNNPKTIREILYWLSALPYNPAYKGLLDYSKGRLKEVIEKNNQKQLSFKQTGRHHAINVEEQNLYAHFQAVTQYCPLVLIGIQGGIHSAKGTDSTKEPAIYDLYANTECNFTYPAVDIQAYNQVVHYIRALFYQLYFLRKQCAVKVAMGGKWRECKYGDGVESKGVISWMCLGCNPMEHDRKRRVGKLMGELDALVKKVKNTYRDEVDDGNELFDVLKAIGEVIIQLGNAQEALERRKPEEIKGVIEQLKKANKKLGDAQNLLDGELQTAKDALKEAKKKVDEAKRGSTADKYMKDLGLNKNTIEKMVEQLENKAKTLEESMRKLKELTHNGRSNGKLKDAESALGIAGRNGVEENKREYSNAKDKISEAIHKVLDLLAALEKELPKASKLENQPLNNDQNDFFSAITKLQQVCSSPKCHHCRDHANKCGKTPVPATCDKCHQQYMDGFPSPLQAFLEDRLPGFSCAATMDLLDKNPNEYPLASSHLYHSNSHGQCCPVPMGFRNKFHGGSTSDCTGARLYGILYFFSNQNMMQSCVYRLVRVTSALSATTPQVLGDVFGFFRGGVGNGVNGKDQRDRTVACMHDKDPFKYPNDYFCGWCASGLRGEVPKIQWIPQIRDGTDYRTTVGTALVTIKGDGKDETHNNGCKGTGNTPAASSPPTKKCHCDLSSLSDCTQDQCAKYISPLTGELYTAVSATFGHVYLQWVLYLSDALEGGLQSLASAFKEIECRGCTGCDPNKCKKGAHGATGNAQCQCQSIVSCTGVLPVLYRHGFSYGNPFNLEGYQQEKKESGDYSITENKDGKKHCHEFLGTLQDVINKNNEQKDHPLTKLISEIGTLQYQIRLPWIFVLTVAWLIAVLYLAFGAIWPLDWTHMRSHWLRGGAHQWQCMWYKVMTGRKGKVVLDAVEYFGREGVEEVKNDNSTLRTVLLSGAKGWGGG